ncbi:MAG: tRNA pseudouridine(55) synthase TruB [Candidatus Eisenbacteria sp.]|nr:tRNA pseudouridine(55) synthase TruB [Candidatus Eisenbacteria bacterium]
MTDAGGLEGQGFVLNIYKESPWTSHDAVRRVRRILGFRKVGHTGTLDPFATGVLLCCVGRATKLSSILMDLPKQYEGWMRFGAQTHTGDAFGRIEREWNVALPSLEALRRSAAGLQGEILQVPPMVSALKHNGQRLYKLARKGITVERKARRVLVESFAILEVDGLRIRFRVRCSRGTYVRTLVEDFGASLGASAYVEELCRMRIGPFEVGDAVRLQEDMQRSDLIARSISMAQAAAHLPAWRIPRFWAAKLRHGHTPPWIVLEMERPPVADEIGCLISSTGELMALGKAVQSEGLADRPWSDALNLELVRVI